MARITKALLAIAALVGTLVGAGFLGIPYVVMQSGFGLGLVNMIVIGIIIALTMLYLGEITLRTSTPHQLSGYAERYLGKKGKTWMFIALIFGIYSAVLAYMIGAGESLSYLFFGTIQYELQFGILFWLILSLITFFGMKALKDGESFGVVLMLIFVAAVAITSYNTIDFANLAYNNYQNLLAPFGVIMFAFLAFSIVPELRRILEHDKRLMKWSIISAYIIAFIVYAVFTLVVLGSRGWNTPQISTLVLGNLFILLGMITLFTAYLALSIALIDSFETDFNISKLQSWIYTISVPLVLFVLLEIFGKASFTNILAIGGIVSGGLTAVLVLEMVKKAKTQGDREPEYSIPYSDILTWILIIIFIVGTVFEIMHLIV